MFNVQHICQLIGDAPLHLLREWRYDGKLKEELMTEGDRGDECRWLLAEIVEMWIDEWFKVAVHRHLVDGSYKGFNHDGKFLYNTQLRSFPLHLVNNSEVSSYINSTYGIFHKEGGRIPLNIYCYYMDEDEGGYYDDDDGFPEYERTVRLDIQKSTRR